MKFRRRSSREDPVPATTAVPDRLQPIGILKTLRPLPTTAGRPMIPLVMVVFVLALAGFVWLLPGDDAADMAVALPDLAAVAPGAGPDGSGDPQDERAPDLLRIAAQELDERRAKLAAREQEVAAREQALRALTATLHAELAELRALRTERDEEQERLEREQEERSVRLARLYESMKPKKAASILDGMPAEDAAGITRRMRDDKAAAVIQQMAPEQATALSELLAKP